MDIVTYALLLKKLGSKANLVDGKVPASELPSYVDDVVEYASVSDFPAEGEGGKIYVALDTGFTYRWSGSEYIQIGGQDLSDYYTKTETNELLATKQNVLTTSAVPNGSNTTYIGFDSNGDLKKDEFTPLSAAEIRQVLENAGKYIIGFSGAAQSNPVLTRTNEAVGATITNNNGVLEIEGIDMSKVWGGYIGNDEEELTWDATSGKYLYNGVEYTGNVFSKINRFFTKAHYVDVSGEQVLDGYQLCYANAAPDNTWQDWFLGKPYTKIGCYKARGGQDWTNGLQSKQGFNSRAKANANMIATASNLNTSTTATMHMKWYNQNSILQVLFMALFATRQTENIFPESTWRPDTNSQYTGYLDEMRAASTCATGYSTSKTGNMFLGIEDFVGASFECLGGVKLTSGKNVQTSLDYDTFDFSNTYTQADINFSSLNNQTFISALQESSSVPGLLLPKKATGTSSTYYCDQIYINTSTGVPIWQGAANGYPFYGVFYIKTDESVSYQYRNFGARLCGEPL